MSRGDNDTGDLMNGDVDAGIGMGGGGAGAEATTGGGETGESRPAAVRKAARKSTGARKKSRAARLRARI